MLEHIIREIGEADRQRKVLRAGLGLGFVAVEVDGAGLGLSANISQRLLPSCSAFSRAGTLKGSPAGDLLDLCREDDLLSRALALATLNALRNGAVQGAEGDVLERIAPCAGERAVMVGYIAPVARALKERGLQIDIFELGHASDVDLRPENEMPGSLAKADIAVITATTLINGSLSRILDLIKQARHVIIMGPSTPMDPRPFASTPVTMLAGSLVLDGKKAFDIIIEGGGAQNLFRERAMKKIIEEVR